MTVWRLDHKRHGAPSDEKWQVLPERFRGDAKAAGARCHHLMAELGGLVSATSIDEPESTEPTSDQPKDEPT